MASPRSGRAAKARVESGAQAAAVVPRKARRLGRSWEDRRPMATSGWAPAGLRDAGSPGPSVAIGGDQGQAKSNCERWIAGGGPAVSWHQGLVGATAAA